LGLRFVSKKSAEIGVFFRLLLIISYTYRLEGVSLMPIIVVTRIAIKFIDLIGITCYMRKHVPKNH